MTATLPYFATGSLCHGAPGHPEIGAMSFVGRGQLRAVGYQLPAGQQRMGVHLRGAADCWLGGELVEADDSALQRLDAWHGAEFARQIVQVRAGSDGPSRHAWTHLFTGAWANLPTWPDGCVAPEMPFSGPTAWYFGYASNMFHMAERRKLTVFAHALGRLPDWQIAFAKDSGNGQHNYATLLPKRGGEVRGALYRMKQAELAGQLDPQEKEGWHLVRRTFEVEITGAFAGQALHDTVGTKVFAEAYICLPRWWLWGRISHPTNTEKIVPGARLVGLDPGYVRWLEAFCNTPSNPEDYDLNLDTRV